jgi:hypothetical protein
MENINFIKRKESIMTNENMEIMEQETVEVNELIEVDNNDEYTIEEIESEAGGGLGALLAIGAGLVTVGGIAVAAIKKHRAKKANAPKKPKTKLKLFVRVPVEEPEEEVVEDAVFEEVNEESTDK